MPELLLELARCAHPVGANKFELDAHPCGRSRRLRSENLALARRRSISPPASMFCREACSFDGGKEALRLHHARGVSSQSLRSPSKRWQAMRCQAWVQEGRGERSGQGALRMALGGRLQLHSWASSSRIRSSSVACFMRGPASVYCAMPFPTCSAARLAFFRFSCILSCIMA